MKGFSLLILSSLFLFSCGKKSQVSLEPPLVTEKLLPYHIQLIAVGKVDSVHWKAAVKSLKEQFPQAYITCNRTSLPITEDQYLVKGKMDSGKQLGILHSNKPDSVNTLIGITAENIAVKERTLSNGKKYKNWSVLGLGSLQRGVCIISYKRSRTIERFTQTVIHEFGHTLGIPHCPNKDCIMQDADGDGDKLLKNPGFCKLCQAQVDAKLDR